ncbi:hypothetical protein GMNKNHGO_00038 [Enterococcus phage vB_Efa29212_3e]|uniref:DUF7448 domain-containing protein n=1 Tax=Enterococcus phage vB_Efa29212_3e TaxID=2982224 RepID=A0A978CU25_9CAUD|nr:hypothetical protein GMNKNHGO_00038 [Enterococcus phage vB_Efa29212_3e]
MSNYDELIGKSVIALEYAEDGCEASLVLNDGSRLKVSCNPEPDCCGYNDFEVILPDGFDFTDNIITKVEDNSEECYGGSTVRIGIFTNDARIVIEGDYGSGSGWNYGEYVDVEIVK